MAAALYRIGAERDGVVEVSLRAAASTTAVASWSAAAPPYPAMVERAVNEADKRDHVDPDQLRKALDSYPGEPGIKRLRKVLDRHTFRLSDQELELLFRPIAESAQTREALRFQVHTASGLTPIRFSHWQVKHEAAHVREILARTAARLRARAQG